MYRAYDTVTEWQGPVRETLEAAARDVFAHNDGCRSQGGYGSGIVVMPDTECDGRCVDLDGGTVWPPHGRRALPYLLRGTSSGSGLVEPVRLAIYAAGYEHVSNIQKQKET